MPKVAKKNGARKLSRSAHDVWLAGLGALTLAEEEGGKLFHMLVRRGAGMESKNRARFDKLIARMKPMGEDAGLALRRVGHGVDNSMTMVLHRLGVPTRREIQGLTKRVEELTHSLERRRPKAHKASHKAESLTPAV